MKKNTIVVAGKQVGVSVNNATDIAFYSYTKKSIAQYLVEVAKNPNNTADAINLILAAIMSYYTEREEEAPVSSNDLMFHMSFQESADALTTVMKLCTQFYAVPPKKGGDKDGADAQNDGDKSKN